MKKSEFMWNVLQLWLVYATILELRIPLIPGEEFERNLTYLEYKTNSFDACESKVLEHLKLLKERRTALISAAVTGKIDVRNWRASESTSTSSMDG